MFVKIVAVALASTLLAYATLAVPPVSTSVSGNLLKELGPQMWATNSAGSLISVAYSQESFQMVASSAQSISAKLVVPLVSVGEVFELVPIDGGTISQQDPQGTLSSSGAVVFTFTPGADYGLYRVVLARPGFRYVMQFWHQNPTRPRRTPATINLD